MYFILNIYVVKNQINCLSNSHEVRHLKYWCDEIVLEHAISEVKRF